MVNTPSSTRPVPLWDMVDGPMPRGVLGLGDPDVHVLDGVPTMFLGGFSTSFRNRLYAATLPPGHDPVGGGWQLTTDGRGRAQALTADPPKGAWDEAGMHTPSYVPATSRHPARMYYTGRSSRRHYGATSRYSIGVLELDDGSWRRRSEPVVTGSGRRRSVLEPLVVHDGERYLMWWQANPHEIGPGDLPDYELQVAESDDGLTWSTPRVFATPAEGFFDNAIARVGDVWAMVLARGADLHGTPGMPAQGLWLSTATAPSPDRGRWSEPVHVLRTDDPASPAHLDAGTYGPGLLARGEHALAVFATGVRTTPSWPRFLARRLLRGRRPVVPSPFYLSVTGMRWDLAPET